MNRQQRNQHLAEKRKNRIRSKIHGTLARPRLSIYRSNKHVYLQAIDDDKGVVLASANEPKVEPKKAKATKTEAAISVAKVLAEQLKTKKVAKLTVDRGPYKYHGRVKAVVETLREQGIGV